MLGSLLSTVAPIAGSVISGMFNQAGSSANVAAQQAINAQNLQFAQKQASGQFLGQYYQNLVTAAGSAGLSPLALLGGNPTSGPSANLVAPQPGAGSLATGQDVSRAAIAAGDNMVKSAELDLAAKRLQIAGMQNDVVAGQMRNSIQARTIAAVGNPPTYAAGLPGSPYFGPVDPFGGPHPDLTRFQSGDVSRSKEKAETDFAGDPWSMFKNTITHMGRDIDDWYGPWMYGLRSDVRRMAQPTPLSTREWFAPWYDPYRAP